MELMIKYSEILTIMIQAFFITVVGFIFVGCGSELLEDIKESKKTLKKRKGGKRNMRVYTCPDCGYIAWALDHIYDTNCHHCGASVKTKPIPKIEKSFLFSEKAHKNDLKFIEK